MSWALLAVGLIGALAAAFAWRSPRREPFGVVAFSLAWIPSELPIHVAVLGAALVALLAALGALGSWPGRVGLVLAVASWVVLGWLAAVAGRSGSVVDAALDDVVGVSGEDPPAGGSLGAGPASWPLVVAVPYRPKGVAKVRNLDYWGDGAKRHRLDVLTRRDRPPERAPVFLYIHGGAWRIGDKHQQGLPMLFELVRRGWVCVTLNYRLSPQASWPEHLVDCKRAVAWVRAHIEEYGGDPGFLAVSGASAGGHLCAMLALTPGEPSFQPGFEDDDTSVDACLPFYGVYDLTGDPGGMGITGPEFLRFLEKRVMQVSAAAHPEVFERASPDRSVNASAPPMLVFHGSNDSLVPVEVARRFVDRLRERSRAQVGFVELPRTQHAFDVLSSIRCRHTTRGVVRFLEGIRQEAADRGPD
jgi:acetyl esterase/lipase